MITEEEAKVPTNITAGILYLCLITSLKNSKLPKSSGSLKLGFKQLVHQTDILK